MVLPKRSTKQDPPWTSFGHLTLRSCQKRGLQAAKAKLAISRTQLAPVCATTSCSDKKMILVRLERSLNRGESGRSEPGHDVLAPQAQRVHDLRVRQHAAGVDLGRD